MYRCGAFYSNRGKLFFRLILFRMAGATAHAAAAVAIAATALPAALLGNPDDRQDEQANHCQNDQDAIQRHITFLDSFGE